MRNVTEKPNRLLSTAIAAALLLGILAGRSTASTKPVLALPVVHSVAHLVRKPAGPKLLVRSLIIRHQPGVATRVSCGGCTRQSTVVPSVTKPGTRVTRYAGLNWLIAPNRYLQVLATEPGAIGRYLVLRPKRPLAGAGLEIQTSGCLNGQRQRIGCPAQSEGPPSPPPPPTTFPETVGGETMTWSDYRNGGGVAGPTIHTGQSVQVSCRVEGLAVADSDSWWYRVASDPWSDRFYASADAFYNNGQTSGELRGTPFYDPGVPAC